MYMVNNISSYYQSFSSADTKNFGKKKIVKTIYKFLQRNCITPIVVRSENGGQGLPCGFALLPNKLSTTYELMIQAICAKVGKSPTTVICDFEQAMWRTLAKTAPEAERRGCQFHFRKAILHKLGELGLKIFYNDCIEFNELVHKFFALSYVPVQDVVQFYEEHFLSFMMDKLDSEKGDEDWLDGQEFLEDFIKYLERTWIGTSVPSRPGRSSSRRPPIFAHDIWNVHEAFLDEDPVITNNGLEAFNRTLNASMGVKPNIWKVIQGFIDQESETKRVLVSNAGGQDMTSNTGRKGHVQDMYKQILNII